MSFRRVTTYACLAVAVGWGFFPSSAHACGLLRWLWGGNDATTAYYAPYTSYYAPTAGCGTGYVAQSPQVSWMPVTNYATSAVTVPVTSYRPNLFGGGLFGCNSHTTQVNRVAVPITNYMPVAAPACNTCPQTSYSLPVQNVYSPPVTCAPTTTYAPPVTYSAPACPSNACTSCNACSPSTTAYSVPTTSYSVPTTSYPTTTTYGPATTTIIEPSNSCSCGSHASSAPVGTGALVGNPTSSYSNGSSAYSSGSTYGSGTVPADSRPTLSGSEAPRIDGNSLGLPETSYSANYGSSSLSLSAPEVRVDSSVTPGPIRSDSSVQFGVPTVRPFDSSARPMNLHSAATETTDASAFGVAPMRDPETRDRDGRLLAPPLIDPHAKTASLPPVGVRPSFDDRIPVMAASFRTETPASLVPVSASLASSAPAIENTGLRLIEDAPVAHATAKVIVDYPVSQTGFSAVAPEVSSSNVTQLDESVWQSARP